MQKVWSFAIIAIIGLVMITSSLPQEVFAGKETLKLSLTVIGGDGKKIQDVDCWVSESRDDAIDGELDKNKRIATDNTGKAGRATFTFDDREKGSVVWANCDNNEEDVFRIVLDEKNKNTRIKISA